MALPNRKADRTKLKSLLEALNVYQVVYKSEHKALKGQSPVATIHSDGSQREKELGDTHAEGFAFLITNYILREGADDEDTVEDVLDDLELAVAQMIDDNTTIAVNWSSAFYADQGAQAGYAMIDGKQYRVESIPVIIRHEP